MDRHRQSHCPAIWYLVSCAIVVRQQNVVDTYPKTGYMLTALQDYTAISIFTLPNRGINIKSNL